MSVKCLVSLPVGKWFKCIKFWIALNLKDHQRPLWSVGTEFHPYDFIHQPKKNLYGMEMYCQGLIHYLLLIDAESWSLKVEVSSSLSQMFNSKQSEELELQGPGVHLMKHQLITQRLLPWEWLCDRSLIHHLSCTDREYQMLCCCVHLYLIKHWGLLGHMEGADRSVNSW